MKLKGSIAVFAVAAAFAGQVAAQVTYGDCVGKIGWAAFIATPSSQQGAWGAVTQATGYFQNSNPVFCSIPKNKKLSYPVGDMTAAQCGIYSKVASASTKFEANKELESQAILGALPGQTKKLVTEGKLHLEGKAIIDTAVLDAWKCVTDWIGQGN